jgi:hypothetical protein
VSANSWTAAKGPLVPSETEILAEPMLDKRFMYMTWTCHGRFMDGAAGDGARTRKFKLGKVTVRSLYTGAPMTDALAQLELFTVSVSEVIVRRESRDLEWFCRKEHQSGNEY